MKCAKYMIVIECIDSSINSVIPPKVYYRMAVRFADAAIQAGKIILSDLGAGYDVVSIVRVSDFE